VVFCVDISLLGNGKIPAAESIKLSTMLDARLDKELATEALDCGLEVVS
jgi:hypothetical protein